MKPFEAEYGINLLGYFIAVVAAQHGPHVPVDFLAVRLTPSQLTAAHTPATRGRELSPNLFAPIWHSGRGNGIASLARAQREGG